jgi:hypothetical protein
VKTKHDKRIVGDAVVHVSYTAPQDGQEEMANLSYDPRDAEFFDLKAGDEIKILVSKSDPTKVRKA